MWGRAEASRDDVVSFESDFFGTGDLSNVAFRAGLVPSVGVGSGEQLSTALSLRWGGESLGPKGGIWGAREAESDWDRRWALDSL